MANLSPFGPQLQYEDSAGEPAVGYRLFFYVNNSVGTKQDTYTTAAGTVANTNPIVLNALGQPANGIFFPAGQAYTIQYAPPGSDDPPNSPIWTRNDVYGVNDVTATQDQWVASGVVPTYVSATSFTLPGDQTSTFTPGRRLKTTNSGGTVYSTVLSSTFGALTTVVVQNESGTLDSGLSAVSYGLISAQNTSEPAIGSEYVAQCRITGTSGTPITTTDVLAIETLYITPFRGNKIDLYDTGTSSWVRVSFSEISFDVPDATQMNDVFVYLSSGVLTVDVTAWASDTARATALTTQNGVLVKSGAVGRRYIGSFYSTTAGNGQTEDSVGNRYVWNYYNRSLRMMRALPTTDTWTYSTTTFRQANNSTANQLNFCVGVAEDAIRSRIRAAVISSTATVRSAYIGVGLDSVTAVTSGGVFGKIEVSNFAVGEITAGLTTYASVGKHYLAWLEAGGGADTQTWRGDGGDPAFEQNGITGELWG
jgi:hypothetical protein